MSIDPEILAAIGHRFIAKNADTQVWGDVHGDFLGLMGKPKFWVVMRFLAQDLGFWYCTLVISHNYALMCRR